MYKYIYVYVIVYIYIYIYIYYLFIYLFIFWRDHTPRVSTESASRAGLAPAPGAAQPPGWRWRPAGGHLPLQRPLAQECHFRSMEPLLPQARDKALGAEGSSSRTTAAFC